jgi:hypothetical protein
MRNWTYLALLLLSVAASYARADIRPDKIHTADGKKNSYYVQDGLFVGGDRAVDEVVVKDIRRATNSGYERVVLDLEGSHNGEPMAIERPPYYQVSVTPDENRLVITLWGKPKLGFDAKKVQAAFKKSHVFQGVDLLPRLEDDTWTFALELKPGHPVEVFELANPVRVIVDVRNSR